MRSGYFKKSQRKQEHMSGRRFISYLFIAGSAALLYLGVREFAGSHIGQITAGREFDSETVPKTEPKTEQSAPHLPRPKLGETIAKLTIPRLDTEVYIVEGDGEDELRRGPGHLAGSAVPGGRGNCIIAGHRDTHFRVLKDIRKGDDIVIETRNGQFLYRVKTTRIVTPDNTAALKPTNNPELNLITCYPFYYVGSAPKRFVVEAQLAGSLGT